MVKLGGINYRPCTGIVWRKSGLGWTNEGKMQKNELSHAWGEVPHNGHGHENSELYSGAWLESPSVLAVLAGDGLRTRGCAVPYRSVVAELELQ